MYKLIQYYWKVDCDMLKMYTVKLNTTTKIIQ